MLERANGEVHEVRPEAPDCYSPVSLRIKIVTSTEYPPFLFILQRLVLPHFLLELGNLGTPPAESDHRNRRDFLGMARTRVGFPGDGIAMRGRAGFGLAGGDARHSGGCVGWRPFVRTAARSRIRHGDASSVFDSAVDLFRTLKVGYS